MKDENVIQECSYFLQPGYMYYSQETAVVHTVVGSCVAVCLWDKRLKSGAINHFLRPSTSDPRKATAEFGNVATVELIHIMERSGSKRADLRAQIIGGGSPEKQAQTSVGPENVAVARKVLERKGIRIVSEDTGGHMGRKVVFEVHTGHVIVMKVQRIRQEDWLTTNS